MKGVFTKVDFSFLSAVIICLRNVFAMLYAVHATVVLSFPNTSNK